MAPVAATGDRHVGLVRRAHLEEVADVVRLGTERLLRAEELIDELVLRAQHPRAPALVGAVVEAAVRAVEVRELAVEALAVDVLVLRESQRRVEHHRAGRREAHAAADAAPAGLRGDHDGAVRRARAVQRRRVRALQHADRLDVRRVDVAGRVAVVDAAVAAVAGRTVVDRDAVDDEERLVVAADRAGAADHDPRRTADRPGLRDLHARGFTRQRVHQVELRHRGDGVAAHRLDRVAHVALLARHPQRGDDQALEPDRLDLHRDVHRLAADLRLDRAVADVREDQRRRTGRYPEDVVARAIRHGSDRRTLDGDLHARERLARRRLRDPAGDAGHLLRRRLGRHQQRRRERARGEPTKDSSHGTSSV